MTDPSHSLAAIEGRLEAATPGPWRNGAMASSPMVVDMGPPLDSPFAVVHSNEASEQEALATVALIAAAPTDLALLVEVAKAAMLTRKRSIALDAALAPLRDEDPA